MYFASGFCKWESRSKHTSSSCAHFRYIYIYVVLCNSKVRSSGHYGFKFEIGPDQVSDPLSSELRKLTFDRWPKAFGRRQQAVLVGQKILDAENMTMWAAGIGPK